MAQEPSSSFDILGIKPGMEATKIVAQGGVDGCRAFLSRICLPAAEELGLLFQDKVRNWRAQNAQKMLEKAELKVAKLPNPSFKFAHPRLLGAIIEHASWSDHDLVQSMWAGLLATSCTEDGQDESNLIFVNLMNSLTRDEVILLNHFCENVETFKSETGWVGTKEALVCQPEEFSNILGYLDIHRFDILLDHLRGLGLLEAGSGYDFRNKTANAVISVSSLGLNLYVRAKGFVGPAASYFGHD